MPNINDFKGNFVKGGARANLFEVTWEPGSSINRNSSEVIRFMCKIATLPSSVITPIDVLYQGRTIRVAGTRPVYPDLTVTIINDEDMGIRKHLEEWMHDINMTEENRRNIPLTQDAYKGSLIVKSLSKNDSVLGGYEFIGCWPTNIAEVTLDWSQDAIQEYTVTWAFDYFKDLNESGIGSNN